MRPDLQIDGTEVMWLEIKIKVGIILLNIIYRSPTEAGSLFWNSYRKMISDAQRIHNFNKHKMRVILMTSPSANLVSFTKL
jgi:hypothetical protein